MVERGKVAHQNRRCFSPPVPNGTFGRVCYFLLQKQKKVGEANHSRLLFFESFFKKSVVEFLMVIAIDTISHSILNKKPRDYLNFALKYEST